MIALLRWLAQVLVGELAMRIVDRVFGRRPPPDNVINLDPSKKGPAPT